MNRSHDRDDQMVHIKSRLVVAHVWPDARFHATQGLGHQYILRYHSVVQTVIDFLGGRIKFQRPLHAGEQSNYLQLAPPS